MGDRMDKNLLSSSISIEKIRQLCNDGRLQWTNHIMIRLVQRDISITDIKSAINTGKIIEQYPDDFPYPSCLVLGLTVQKLFLHVVCGVADDVLWLITAYYPSTNEWDSTFTRRKGK